MTKSKNIAQPSRSTLSAGIETLEGRNLCSVSTQINFPIPPILQFNDNFAVGAKNVGTVQGAVRVSDNIALDSDPDDFRKFAVSETTNFRAELTGLSLNADLTLYASDGTTILAQSSHPNARSDVIAARLAAGTYYIDVHATGRAEFEAAGWFTYLGPTSSTYSLGLYTDRAGNSMATAKSVNHTAPTGVQQTSFNDFVGNNDVDDFYRINLSAKSPFKRTLNVDLTPFSGDVDIELIKDKNGNGKVDPGEVIGQSFNDGLASEHIFTYNPLDNGSYFVRVHRYSGESNYVVTFSSTPVVQID